jgi:hypothetical protein
MEKTLDCKGLLKAEENRANLGAQVLAGKAENESF